MDVDTLPYNEVLLDWLNSEKDDGRTLVLCTAADAQTAHAVARHLCIFDEVIASDGQTNLAATRKADRLVQRFGHRGFDYAGNLTLPPSSGVHSPSPENAGTGA